MIKHTHFHCANCNKTCYTKQNMFTTYAGTLVCDDCIKTAASPEIRFYNFSVTTKRNQVKSSYVRIVLDGITPEEAEIAAKNEINKLYKVKSLDIFEIKNILPAIQ